MYSNSCILHVTCFCLCVLFTCRNIYKDKQDLELIAQSEDEVDNWKASLLRAGVYPIQDKSERNDDDEVHWWVGHNMMMSL